MDGMTKLVIGCAVVAGLLLAGGCTETQKGTGGIFFLQDLAQFGKNPATTEAFEKIHLDRIGNQAGSQFADCESESLLKSDGPEDPGGILYKAQVVKDPNGFFIYILLGRKKIDECAESIRIEPDGKRIDGKIAPEQIQFDGAHFNCGQCGRILVILHSG